MRNKRRLTALVLMVAAAAVVAGGLMASNMGFKLNYQLKAQAPGISKSGRTCIGLPFNRQVGIDTAAQLNDDIGAFSIERFDSPTDSNAPYPPSDYNLTAGHGYLARVLGDTDYIIVGSHDPGLTVQFKAQSPGVSKSGRTRYAHPYHGVASTASELNTEIGSFSIERFDSPTDSNAPYPPADFNLTPGACYLVRVLSDTDYVPAHY